MLEHLRTQWARIIGPVADLLVRSGLSPDAVTWVGTVGTVATAAICFPRGWLWQGSLILLVFILSDSLDGTMARRSGRSSAWGAFLDSTLDRIADGAIFGGLALWYAGPGDSMLWCAVAVTALVLGQVTSYSKARGESLGCEVHGGLAGRADRLAVGLVGAFVTGLGVPWVLPAGLAFLSVAGAVTVGQRMLIVRRQIVAQSTPPQGSDQPPGEPR